MDGEGERVEELGAGAWEGGGCDEGHVFEADAVVAFVGGALDVGEGEEVWVRAARWVICACVHAVEGGEEGVDARRVPGEFGEVFDAVHYATTGVGEGEH